MEIKPIKLSAKKNGSGQISSFTINIGIAEARNCGFLNEEDLALDIEKIIDVDNKQIVIRLKED